MNCIDITVLLYVPLLSTHIIFVTLVLLFQHWYYYSYHDHDYHNKLSIINLIINIIINISYLMIMIIIICFETLSDFFRFLLMYLDFREYIWL